MEHEYQSSSLCPSLFSIVSRQSPADSHVLEVPVTKPPSTEMFGIQTRQLPLLPSLEPRASEKGLLARLPRSHYSYPSQRPEAEQLGEPHCQPSAFEICNEEIDLQYPNYEVSARLRNMLRLPGIHRNEEEVTNEIHASVDEFARNCKLMYRNAKKDQILKCGRSLGSRQKATLRSRREAKVHRLERKQREIALKATIAWLLEEMGSRSCSRCLLR